MQCDECLIDMRVKNVKNNIFKFECAKCGKVSSISAEEIEKKYKNENKEAL